MGGQVEPLPHVALQHAGEEAQQFSALAIVELAHFARAERQQAGRRIGAKAQPHQRIGPHQFGGGAEDHVAVAAILAQDHIVRAADQRVDIAGAQHHHAIGGDARQRHGGGRGRCLDAQRNHVDVQQFGAVLGGDVDQMLQGLHVLITAGPTQEAIDPVRYLSNRSSGKMGYALAQAACMAGAQVTLVSGPSVLSPPLGVNFYSVNTAQAMFDTVMQQLKPGMIFIGAAAVADYRILAGSEQKIKKTQSHELTLSLIQNPDILATVAASKKAALVVGFAAETTHVLEFAAEKLRAKKLDMVIANQVGADLGFDVDDNQVTILTKNGQIPLPRMNKTRLAGQIIAILATIVQNDAQ